MAIFTAIGSAIAGALFTSAASIALATQVIATGLAFGVSVGFSYLKRPKARKYSAVQGETKYGGDVNVETLFGPGKTKGQRLFYAKYGAGNKHNVEVFALANGWCDGLEPYVNFYGKKQTLVPTTISGTHTAAYYVEGFADRILILFFDGRPGQLADTNLINNTTITGQTWKETSTLANMCYVTVFRTYKPELFSQGKPDFEFVLRGLREYDPRKDSTVSGGSGPQRINDPATWVYTKNPAVHRLNYQLGLRAQISSRTLVGEGKSLGQIDLATYFVAMNVCDTIKDGKATYECGLWANGADDHTEILKEFDDAMAGYGLNRRGLAGIIAGAPQIPVADIGPDDMDIERSGDYQFKKSAFERYNHLSGQYTSIEDMWNPQSLKPIYVNADIAADGKNRQTSNDFLQVTDPDIAQYLLTIRYRQQRMGGTATLPVSRRLGLKVQEGEWVTWSGRTWMITEWQCDEQFRITLKLSETSADIYDPGDIEPGPVVIPPTPPVNPSIITTVSGFRIETGIIQGANGFEQPTLRFSWDPPEDPTITQVRFEYRINGKTAVYTDASNEPEKGVYETSKDVQSGVIYDARATITTVPDRFRTFTVWVTSLTATGYSSVRTDLEHLGQDAKDVFKQLGGQVSEFFQKLETIGQSIALEGAVSQVSRDSIRKDVGAAYAEISEEKRLRVTADEAIAQQINVVSAGVNDNAAKIVEERTARADADSALTSSISSLSSTVGGVNSRIATEETTRANADSGLASSITALTTTVNGNTAAIGSESNARVDADNAISTRIDGVSATFNGMFADGLVMFQATAAPAGVTVRFSIMLRANLSSSFIESGMYIQIRTVGGVLKSEIGFLADKFVVVDGVNTYAVFAIEDGQVKIVNAKISQAQIDNLMVGESNIQAGIVRKFTSGMALGPTVASNNWTYGNAVTVTHTADSPYLSVVVNGYTEAGGIEWRCILNSPLDGDLGYDVVGSLTNAFSLAYAFRPPSGRTQTQFRVASRGNGGASPSNSYQVKECFFTVSEIKAV